MADITLNVEVRERTGTGDARAVRRQGKVPGILYGGPRDPVALSVPANEFRKALSSGKLTGHLVTLKYGDETQPVIAKDIQFDPVTDQPVHFDLYRVDEHQLVRIAVPVQFINEDACPGIRRGGVLNVVRHEVDLWAPADSIPELLTVDLTGLDIGDAIRVNALKLPSGVDAVAGERDFVVANVTGTSAQAAQDAAADEASASAQAAASAAEAG